MSRKFNVKARTFPDVKISDMYRHLIPILNKKLDRIACRYKLFR